MSDRGAVRTWVDNHVMDTFQMWWMVRSAWKSIYFGAVISILMVGAATLLRRSADGESLMDKAQRFQIIGSFVFDNLMIYCITAVAFALGLAVSTWDATLIPIRKNFKQYVNYAVGSVFISLILVFIWIQIAPMLYQSNALSGVYVPLAWLNMIVAGTFGLAQTWRSFYIYSVLNKSERRKFLNKRQGDGAIRATFRWFFPFADKSRLTAGLLWSALIVVGALTVSSALQTWANGNYIVNTVAFTITLSLFSALLGILIRVWNSVKPWGIQDSLYPHWERKQGFVKINPNVEG